MPHELLNKKISTMHPRKCRRLIAMLSLGFSVTLVLSIGQSYISRGKLKHYGHLTSNIAESLNSWILKARELVPILAMLETIHHQPMDWFAARSKLELNTKGLLVQKVANDIQKSLNNRARRYNLLKLI